MTGKEAIIHYLGTHNSFCAPDVAALTGATVTSINQAAAKMARAGLLVIEGKVWRHSLKIRFVLIFPYRSSLVANR